MSRYLQPMGVGEAIRSTCRCLPRAFGDVGCFGVSVYFNSLTGTVSSRLRPDVLRRAYSREKGGDHLDGHFVTRLGDGINVIKIQASQRG